MLLFFAGFTILNPYARYSFNMEAIRRLFRVRTADRKLLKHPVDKKSSHDTHGFVDYKFSLSPYDKAHLFLAMWLRCLRKGLPARSRKYLHIYTTGKERLYEALSVYTVAKMNLSLND
jgi:hypothetical protein